MEERKNHPSLPSNYLTLAQLQERWLKQQNQINQPQPQEQQNQQPQPPQEVVVAPRNGTASRSRSRLQKQYVAKNLNDSETRRRAIAVASVDTRKSEVIAGIGDETSDLNGKVCESKKNKWNKKGKWKTKTEKRVARGEGSGTAAQGKEEAEKKATIENELKEEKKSGDSETVEEIVEQRVRVLSIISGNEKKKNGGSVTAEDAVEQSVRVLSIISGNGKQNNERLGKMSNNGSGTAAQWKKEDEKTTIENDIKEKKNGGGSLTVEEAEQKVRVSSNSSGNVKQNGGLGKMNNGFRHSQSQRKYYGGEASYGYGYGNLKVGVQRTTKKKMVWVKKEEIVGGIET